MKKGAFQTSYKDYKFEFIDARENRTIYDFSNDTGTGYMNVCNLLPGIQVSYNHIAMEYNVQSFQSPRPILQIDYCYDGAFEYQFVGEHLKFFSVGDFAISDYSRNHTERATFPFNKYEGISLFIDLDEGQKTMDKYFEFAEISLADISRRILGTSCTVTLKNKSEIKQALSAVYLHEKDKSSAYAILKIVEVLIYLSEVDTQQVTEAASFTVPVYQGTKECYSYILSHPFAAHSIGDLADRFALSQSSLKRCFTQLTGCSIGDFIIRTCIEASAELLLEERDVPISEIAHKAGYTNQSKYIAAFKRYYHETPLVYRNSHLT